MVSVLCKVALGVLLIGLGAIEYMHHAEHGPEHVAKICADPNDPRENAKALFQQHLYSHR
jgi:hypothetical protein